MHNKPYIFKIPLVLFLCLLLLVSCTGFPSSDQKKETSSSKSFVTEEGRGEPLRIVSGSENKVLEPILEKYAKESGQKISMDYMGSLDIMRLLEEKEIDYDAVWPASSIWLNMGDKNHVLKHRKTIAVTPVIFGIRQSLAEDLGFVGRDDIHMKEIGEAIESGKLRFAMTSATQSNSGASAYLAFLTSLSKNPQNGLSLEDLDDPSLKKNIKNLLSGVNRSSGSSNWLVDLFLMGNYDAMVNYEQLIIQTNQALKKEGKETLYAVYPVDGLSISDSPLAYVDKENNKKEKAFLELQDYLLSEEGQDQIEKTGKRNAFSKINEKNKGIYKKDWGIRVDQALSPIRLPKKEVIEKALALYQEDFKKPAYTVYVLDYSYSMKDTGHDQMIQALKEIWIPENARRNLLLGTEKDVSIFLPFGSNIGKAETAQGNDLNILMKKAREQDYMGSTSLYEATAIALKLLTEVPDLTENYNPAIVLLTDGLANGPMEFNDFKKIYNEQNLDVPIFSIQFGAASKDQLDKLAELSRARVFDGREDLKEAFRQVKGYN